MIYITGDMHGDMNRFTAQKVWFEQELPSPEEYQRGLQSLKAHNSSFSGVVLRLLS